MIEASTNPHPVISVVQRPKILAVVSPQAGYQSAISGLLERAGLPAAGAVGASEGAPVLVGQEALGPPEAWAAWLTEQPEAHLLLVMSLPTVDLAWRLQQGSEPEATLADWLGSAQALLDVIRPRRRRFSLVFAETALTAPQEFLDRIAQRLGLQLQTGSPDMISPDLPSALLRLIAESLLGQSMEARSVAAELEATALPLPAGARCRLPAMDQVFSEYRDGIQLKAVAQELSEEKDLLLQQLNQVQEELEQRHLQNTQSAEELRELRENLQAAEERLSTVEQEKTDQLHEDLREENELLLNQVYQLQEELEREHLQGLQNTKEVGELRLHLQGANDIVEALYNSKSWKITKPLRVMLDLFAGGKKAS